MQTFAAAPPHRASDLVHVPFGGGAPTAATQLINDGELRALAVTSKTGSSTPPGVPTLAESGYPDIEGDGFVVPVGTAKDVIALLNREIVCSLAGPR